MTGPAGAASPTSTTVAPPDPPKRPTIRKQSVRPKDGWLTAVPIETPGQLIRLIDGTIKVGQANQYQIQQAGQTLAICTEEMLRKVYDVREDGGMRIPQEEKRAIEDCLGIGSMNSAAALLAAVKRLAVLKIGTVEVMPTTWQWEEIQHRAGKNGRTVEQEVKWIAERLEDELFHGGVARSYAGKV